ncbi:MAG: hypothetical protein R2751_08955 [Bacteroidales bacterium]
MRNKFFLKGMALFVGTALVVGGCNKEDEVPSFEEMTFQADEVLNQLPVGLTASNDEYAEMCVDFIESAVDMSAFSENLTPPDNARKSDKKGSGDTWTWTWSYLGESFTFYWTYDEDSSKKYWSMDIQFGAGPVYDYIDAWEAKDGSQGHVEYNFNWVLIYEEDPGDYEDLFWTYDWSLDSNGTYTFEMTYDSSAIDYDYYLQYSVVVNDDGSGTVDYYLMGDLFYHMEWDALGNGSYAYYYGDFETTGTWSAG